MTDHGPTEGEQPLVLAFLTSSGLLDDLRLFATRAARSLGADGAMITVIEGDRRHTVGSKGISDELEIAHDLQFTLGEGPCTEIGGPHDPSIVLVLEGDPRWPAWNPQAAELGVRAALAAYLSDGREIRGALAVYSTQERVFDTADLVVADLAAAHISSVLATHSEDADHGGTGHGTTSGDDPVSVHRISRAHQVLMERFNLDADRAIELLSHLAQDNDIELDSVAHLVVTDDESPT